MQLRFIFKNLDFKVNNIVLFFFKNWLFFYKKIFNFPWLLNLDLSALRLPTRQKEVTVLKSPHIDKKARDQFEMKQNKCIIDTEFNLLFNKYIRQVCFRYLNKKLILLFRKFLLLSFIHLKYMFIILKKSKFKKSKISLRKLRIHLFL